MSGRRYGSFALVRIKPNGTLHARGTYHGRTLCGRLPRELAGGAARADTIECKTCLAKLEAISFGKRNGR